MISSIGRRSIQLFPFGIVIFSLHAWQFPALYKHLSDKIPWMLAAVMLGVGMTLRMDDFKPVLQSPRLIGLGMAAQFGIMPFTAYLIAKWFKLPDEIALGLILVGSCPGGMASNVMTYLARGDVAYSVVMTSCSTLIAPILTPLLTWLLCGTFVHVSMGSLFISTFQIIILPILAGIALHYFLIRWMHYAVEILPLVSSLMIVLIVATIVSMQHEYLGSWLGIVLLAVIVHNTVGLAGGYVIGVLSGLDTGKKRALAIEVGMQNSGLAVALATLHFSAGAAVAGAIFSVWQNLSASALSSFWVRRQK